MQFRGFVGLKVIYKARFLLLLLIGKTEAQRGGRRCLNSEGEAQVVTPTPTVTLHPPHQASWGSPHSALVEPSIPSAATTRAVSARQAPLTAVQQT